MGKLISEKYQTWKEICQLRSAKLKANEEELNQIFISAYGLQKELTPEVHEDSLTVRQADLKKEIRSLLSYAVGCMFGRYSLDQEGLVYAGGFWNAEQYQRFQPCENNILPLCDGFGDNILCRLKTFLCAAYGADTLTENMQFIASALDDMGAPEEKILAYFQHDFYADHCRMYQKRPIYWLFRSGRRNAFQCLVYMHRYQPDNLMHIRTDYVQPLQQQYRNQPGMQKELLDYTEKLLRLETMQIPIYPDNGVQKNYALFQSVLAKIK